MEIYVPTIVRVSMKTTRERTAMPISLAMFPLPYVLTLQYQEELSTKDGSISYQQGVFQTANDIPGHIVII